MNEFNLTPEQYQEIIDKTRLATISLENSSSKLSKQNTSDKPAKISLKDSVSSIRIDDKNAELLIEYNLSIKKDKKVFLTIKATYSLLLIGECELPEEFIKIYEDTSLRFHSYPYFRNFVQDTTSRMCIPPLTLPFYKIGKFS
jgi:preprotein translocase subunit SecB